jgi:molecular chaperone GrpE (heat shock protein)
MKWLPSLRRETSESEAPNVTVGEPETSAVLAPFVPTMVDPLIASTSAETERPRSDEGTAVRPSIPADTAEDSAAADIASRQTIVNDAAGGPANRIDISETLEKVREDLLRKQQELNDAQRALNELFSTRLRSDEAQARAVEKLHDELRQYKANFVRQQLLPMLKEVIFCHDFVSAHMERLASENIEQPGHRPLEATRQMLIDLLFKYDVEPYRSEGEPFDPKTQQCTHTIPIDRPEADKTVATRGLPGFRGPEGIVRREQVSVYKFTPGAD